MESLEKEILKKYGGLESSNLNSVLKTNEDTDEEIETIIHSQYYNMDNIQNISLPDRKTFNILSINIQSLNAKYDNLVSMLSILKEYNIAFSAICIQESWLNDYHDVSLVQISGYNMIHQGKQCCGHGGLIIYLQDQFQYTVRNMYDSSNVWEGLFIDIGGEDLSKKVTLCNIYRPSTRNENNQVIDQFITEISPIVENLSKENSTLIFAGDFNINLLNINEREKIQDYFDLFVSRGLFPKITLPTRLSTYSGTLIDQIFVRNPHCDQSSLSGIFFSTMSDHMPCFSFLDIMKQAIRPKKYITVHTSSPEAVKSFCTHIKSTFQNISLDPDLTTDPNKNYNIFHDELTKAKDKHLPTKLKKFNKRKHKLI